VGCLEREEVRRGRERPDTGERERSDTGQEEDKRRMMSTHASVLVDSVGPPSAEVCRAAESFP
jgi:hypothetical protein